MRQLYLLILALVAAVSFTPGHAIAQDAAATDYVPQFAIASLRTNPINATKGVGMEYMPTEVAMAWSRQKLGVDLNSIQEIKLVAGLIRPETPPQVGAVIRLNADFDPANISDDLKLEQDVKQVGGHDVHVLGVPGNPLYVHTIDARTVIVAMPGMLSNMLETKQGKGPIADLIADNPLGDNDVQFIVAIEPLRPLLAEAIEAESDQLPPELQELTTVPDLLKALVFESQSTGRKSLLQLEMICPDARSASELQEIVERGIEYARVMLIAEMTRNIPGDGRMPEAQRAYLSRIINHFAGLLKPEQDNDRLVLQTEAGFSMAHTGILIGLLLPAVQAAREAARRTSAANNLKQIGLAMHNYHDAYKKWPPAAISNDDGDHLLSWRVAILPFLGLQGLYDQFHLDEPWDSDHNLKLVPLMPSVFSDPSALAAPGMTVFHACVGEGLAFEQDQESQIRNMTDGTSNTIMVVEVDRLEAVEWTKPADVEIDMDNPLDQMGHSHAGGFQVLFGDGSVRFISHSIDQDLFRSLLTRAGGEQVGGF